MGLDEPCTKWPPANLSWSTAGPSPEERSGGRRYGKKMSRRITHRVVELSEILYKFSSDSGKNMSVRHNRTVFAEIKFTEPNSIDFAQSAFNSHGWTYKEVEDRHVIAIPVYSARSGAIQAAKNKLRAFSSTEFPIITRELRTLEPSVNREKVIRVSRRTGGILDWLPPAIGTAPEYSLVQQGWEISITPSMYDAPATRMEDERERAKEALIDSKLPGLGFNADTMKAVSFAGRKKVANPDNRSPWKLLPSRILILSVATATVFAAGFAYNQHSPVWVRILLAAISLGSCIFSGLWLTGDRTSVAPRVALIVALAASIAVIGGVAKSAVERSIAQESGLVSILIGIPALGIILMIIAGWIHLLNLHPRLTSMLSIATLVVVFTASTAYSQVIFAAAGSIIGLSSEEIAIPSWFRILTSLITFLLIMAGVVCVGSIMGWYEYYGGKSETYPSRMLSIVLMITLFGSFLVMPNLVFVGQAGNVVSGWSEELRSGITPSLAGDFVFLACVLDEDGKPQKGDDSKPIAVIKGTGGNFWRWNLNSKVGPVTSPLRTKDLVVTRVPDHTSQCVGAQDSSKS